jgi:large subunit ribosomal protein L18
VEETLVAKNSRYCLPFRRRREGKTVYKARKAFLLSGKPRLVARCSVKNVSAQIIAAKPGGDQVLVSTQSKELARKYGWKAPGGNLPAAYLTGLLCGLKARSHGIEEAILDVGLHSPSKGSRVFAVLKGVLDAEVNVPHSGEKLPDEKRIWGDHVAKYAKSLESNPEDYKSRFSNYLKKKIPPEKLPEHAAQVKTKMIRAFKRGGSKIGAKRPKKHPKK